MEWVAIVTLLALAQFFYFGLMVGRARVRFGVKAPATTGNEDFERVFRVQMNTLELLIIFVPSIRLFATYVSAPWAAGLGAVYIVGRFLYFAGYSKAANKRGPGFGLSMLPTLVLLIGGLIGAGLALLHRAPPA
jgi:glutathione S-transferase